jgi:predicted dehydrogenase
MAEALRVAVIGAGYFGRLHVEAWTRIEQASLVAVCDTTPGRAAAVLAEAGAEAHAVETVEAMLATRPDLVDIAAPPAAHAALIEALAPQVPMLICQKPFCGGLDAARTAVAVAARHEARLAVHENVRFQPWYTEAGRLIAAGALGTVMQASFRLRPGDGQGPDAYSARQPYFRTMPRFLIHETGVHWIDTFRALLGEPTGIFARLARLNPAIAGEDAGLVLFDFASGARALFDGNRLADHASDNPRRTLGEMLIEGTAATLRLDGAGRLWLRAFGTRDEAEHRFAWEDRGFGGDCVALCNRAIVADWLAGRTSPVEATAYLRTLEIEEAVYRSAETARYVPL